MYMFHGMYSLQWRHNERDDVSNQQPHDCLLNRLFKAQIKETSKLRVAGLCTGEFPAQRASNTENVSFWWRHHIWDLRKLPHVSCYFIELL